MSDKEADIFAGCVSAGWTVTERLINLQITVEYATGFAERDEAGQKRKVLCAVLRCNDKPIDAYAFDMSRGDADGHDEEDWRHEESEASGYVWSFIADAIALAARNVFRESSNPMAADARARERLARNPTQPAFELLAAHAKDEEQIKEKWVRHISKSAADHARRRLRVRGHGGSEPVRNLRMLYHHWQRLYPAISAACKGAKVAQRSTDRNMRRRWRQETQKRWRETESELGIKIGSLYPDLPEDMLDELELQRYRRLQPAQIALELAARRCCASYSDKGNAFASRSGYSMSRCDVKVA